MTITLDLTPDQLAKLEARAAAVGVAPTEFLMRVIDPATFDGEPPSPDMADHLRIIGVLGAVKGNRRADGRPWSEIEASCDAD